MEITEPLPAIQAAAPPDQWGQRTPMSHTIAWLLEPQSTVTGTLTCLSPHGDCHFYCPNDGCEEGCTQGHPQRYAPGCIAIEWIENYDGPTEAYAGPPVPPADGPVVLSWEGEDWQWSYPPVDPA